MAMMNRGRTRRPRLTLAVLVLASITILTLDFRGVGVLDDARELTATLVRPLRGVAGFVATPVSNIWNGITGYPDLAAENEALRDRVAELEGQGHRNDAVAAQFDELTSLLDLPWVGNTPTVAAQVISQPPSAFSHVIEINKGSDSGIAEGMPVVSGAGLVGRVVQVTAGRSAIQLITDPDFRVGVRITDPTVGAESGQLPVGTAQGRGVGEDLLVDTGLEPGTTNVEPGTLLTTSGIDQRSAFPGAIPVGFATRTREGAGGLSLQILIEPAAHLQAVNFVNVLLWRPAE